MHSLADLRRRIRSIGSTEQITRAMQMVAASKMRKAQEAALAGRPFVQLLYRIQREATTRAAEFSHPLLQVREVRKLAAEFAYGDSPTYAQARAIAGFARDLFLKGEADQVQVVATRFINTLTQRPVCIEFLPVGEVKGMQIPGMK